MNNTPPLNRDYNGDFRDNGKENGHYWNILEYLIGFRACLRFPQFLNTEHWPLAGVAEARTGNVAG